MKWEKGTLLQDRYSIEALIGEGGMSYVYRARDQKLGRTVAIKVLKSDYAEDQEFVRKFQDEAKAAAKLNHLNIVSAYDVVDEGDTHFIVMELVEGITLKNYIHRKGKCSEREAIGIALQLVEGMDTAHKMGIVHRDIKPQNMIVSTEGVVKIADFGIARAASQETANTAVMGSVHYISPEQARRGVSDQRSDIYSLGCTIYEMLTGKLPYEGENSMAVVFSHMEDPIPRVRDLEPEVSPALDYVVWKAMQKKPSARYQTVEELRDDLNLALEDPEAKFLNDRQDEGDESVSRQARQEMDKGISRLYKALAILSVVCILGVFLFLGFKLVGMLRSVKDLSPKMESATEKETEESTQVAITISALDSLLPDIVGKTIPEAEKYLSSYDIKIYPEKEEFSEKYEEGQIISYPSGKYGVRSRLYVTVSKGSKVLVFYDKEHPEDLTKLQQMELSTVEKELKDREIPYKVVEQMSDTVEKGYLISTNKADTSEPGELELVVSTGIPDNWAVVPDLTNLSEKEAISALEGAGLEAGVISYIPSTSVAKGVVLKQSVAKDSYVERGQAIPFSVSSGPDGESSTKLAPSDDNSKAWVSSINQTVVLGSGGPGVEGTVLVVVYLRQDVNGESRYTTLQAARSYVIGSEMQLSISRIKGIAGLSKGTVEVVDAEKDRVLAAYDLDFAPEA
ncbi:protein kinase domain-containing protein [Oribacterium sinus]